MTDRLPAREALDLGKAEALAELLQMIEYDMVHRPYGESACVVQKFELATLIEFVRARQSLSQTTEGMGWRDLLAAAKAIIPSNVALGNSAWPDNTILPLDVTLGELRALRSAIDAMTPPSSNEGEIEA